MTLEGLTATELVAWVVDGSLDQQTAAAEIERRVAAARDELEKQWRVNHDEHCRNEWPHDVTCYWPRPAVLDEVRD